ncbi:hypothetical protein [Legionella bononiensis]|uniref:hypothetical protein n=1 Tax=Legionella bononiensis TaxID=2793102 RepID=UPI001933D5D6|nr:hypothetical protein [Legionella bononiensis]
MSLEMANDFYNSLIRTIQWENDEAIIYGKKIITKRKVAWYANQPFSYTYSKITKTAKPWIPILDELKAIVEGESGEIITHAFSIYIMMGMKVWLGIVMLKEI